MHKILTIVVPARDGHGPPLIISERYEGRLNGDTLSETLFRLNQKVRRTPGNETRQLRIMQDNDRTQNCPKVFKQWGKNRWSQLPEKLRLPCYSPDGSVLDSSVFGMLKAAVAKSVTKSVPKSLAGFRTRVTQALKSKKLRTGAGLWLRGYKNRLQEIVESKGYVL
jgi:hypothetical protein